MPKKKTESAEVEKSTTKKSAAKAPAAKTTRKSAVKKDDTAAKAPAKSKAKAPAKSTTKKAAAPTTRRKAAAKAAPVSAEQRAEQVRIAAYYRWEQKGCPEGSHIQDWLEAEDSLTD